MAKEALLHSVRVLDCNAGGTLSDLIAGIDWVVQNAVFPAVMNISVVAGSSVAVNEARVVLSSSSRVRKRSTTPY